MLGARAQLVGMTTRLSNHIRVCSRPSACCPEPGVACHSTGASRSCSPTGPNWTNRSAHADRMAATAPADRRLRQSSTPAGEVEPHLPSPDGRARDRSTVCAGLCQHGRGPGTLRPITICRRASRANAKTISVGRDRPQRQNIEMRRQTGSHADVRSGGGVDDAGQTGFRPEGLGPGDCQAIRRWQGARGACPKTRGDPAQHVAVGGAIPLVRATGGRLRIPSPGSIRASSRM